MASALLQQAWRGLARAGSRLVEAGNSGSNHHRNVSALLLRGLASATPTTPTPAAAAGAVAAAAAAGAEEGAGAGASRQRKHKTPRRIATSLLASLRQTEHAKGLEANAQKEIPAFRPGDAVEVKMVTHLTSKEVDTFRGVVLGIRSNGADSRFTIADVFLGTPILSDIPLYSPFIKSVKVLGRAHIHKGKKRVRRSKLYYLWEKRDPKEFAISG